MQFLGAPDQVGIGGKKKNEILGNDEKEKREKGERKEY
ncbi:hypothetical protein TRV_02617 [Trichophyton verrucosum HKI 0517]|uniref:Uncharacterized protein n=1 Tax=Trichophyton verrucosum (strain HKI 0517) TaxID=663202 RepID=D4D694_TRIVH|nr:uncharacterized protein TRV_02617 [Trichophyton verrucosum HKI 0517]EFE42665.1 hypothetical protein TRV_02617 [Trichophyton verrucosum HKI 0517]